MEFRLGNPAKAFVLATKDGHQNLKRDNQFANFFKVNGEELDLDIDGNKIVRARNLAVFSIGLASGGFGSVYEAFDPESGELRVVKVVQLKSESATYELQPEINIVTKYPNSRGLVRQYRWCNSNGDSDLTAENYPVNIYLV